MNDFEKAKNSVVKETKDYVFNKLKDKNKDTITKDTLMYALYHYDIPKPQDEKVFDEMLEYLQMPKTKRDKKEKRKKIVVSDSDSDENGEGEDETEVDFDHFERIFNSFKFKITGEGNITN